MSEDLLESVVAELADLQSRYLFQEDLVQVLNDQVVDQQRQIDLLNRKMELLVEQLRSQESLSGGSPEVERPPHY